LALNEDDQRGLRLSRRATAVLV